MKIMNEFHKGAIHQECILGVSVRKPKPEYFRTLYLYRSIIYNLYDYYDCLFHWIWCIKQINCPPREEKKSESIKNPMGATNKHVDRPAAAAKAALFLSLWSVDLFRPAESTKSGGRDNRDLCKAEQCLSALLES